ncbi:hypothetical protein M758_1G267100 [Ceratodon purpureus]|uniref:WAT1-related protein n=1 Tax=Ceratodon purpureus TaxID=3225 RepID=A0A8T0JCU0_CERPU|nr:hypothetical protein KC19_1G274900 [Ceratodon purpureus]KAG0631618.1 hypothetical protein M758_1G267100 [Ceratodon purpureus]
MGLERWLDRAKVHVAMILAGAGYGGYFVLTKASLSGGVDPFVFSTYRDGIGCIVLFLYAFYFERQQWRKMSLEVAGLIVAMAIVGVYLQQALFLFGLQYTNVVFASLVMNCIPVWAFLIAAIFGIEEVAFNRRDGQAKVLGILLCVSGATILTLYKGPAIFGDPTPVSPLPGTTVSLGDFLSVLQGWEIDQWRLGALCLVADSFFCGAFVNLQVPALKRFPAAFTLMSAAALIGGIMFATTAFFRVKLEPSEWILSPGPDLIAVIYAGIVASGSCLFLQCWSNQKSGPVFVAAYSPMQPIFSTFFGVLFLGDPLFLGSVLGATSILSGLFLVIWGIQENLRLKTLLLQIPTHGTYSVDAMKPTSVLVEPLLS